MFRKTLAFLAISLLVTQVLAQSGPKAEADRDAPITPTRELAEPPRTTLNAPPPNIAELLRRNNGSLFRAANAMPDDPRLVRAVDVSPFAVPPTKPRTLQKHDLVTIIVREQSQYASDGTTETQKDGSIDAKIEQFPTIDFSNFALKNTVGSVVPQVKLSGKRDFNGEGSIERTDSFTARIQAEVVDVKPNGTLVLQARKRIVTDEDEQLFVLSGVCRVQDILPDNTILSTQLFDSELKKTHTGVVRDSTKRGWVPRALDWLNPF